MSVRKYKLLILVQCIVAGGLCAQQMPQVSHYMFTPQMYNPASVGFSNSIVASAIHRQQWYGMEGAPQTTLVSVDAPIRIIQSGVGLNMTNDQIGGIYNNTTLQLAYNYQLPVWQGVLGMGVQGGLHSMGMGLSGARPPTSEPDPVLQGKEDLSKFLFDVSLGLFYHVAGKYEIGASLLHINQPEHQDLAYRQRRCLNLSGNYHFTLDAFPSINFVPSTLIKYDFTTMQMDLSLVGVHNRQYWGGLSYRLGEAVVLMGGLFIKQFQVGLAYDLVTNWLIKGSKMGGGFELFARCNFNLSVDRLPKSYKNSRFL